MRLNHITLIVSDFERSREFYSRLGLTQIVDSPPRYARFQFPDGEATLSIEVKDEAREGVTNFAQLYFECPDLDATVAALKSGGVRFDQEPTDMPYLWREAHLSDPNGHQIRLYFAGQNRLDPPWKMSKPPEHPVP